MPTIDPYKLITNGSLADVADSHPKTHRPGRNTGDRGLHVTRGHPPTIMTDDEVLECRALHEFDGVAPGPLCRWYGVDPGYMRKLLSYEARSRLIPSPTTKRDKHAVLQR